MGNLIHVDGVVSDIEPLDGYKYSIDDLFGIFGVMTYDYVRFRGGRVLLYGIGNDGSVMNVVAIDLCNSVVDYPRSVYGVALVCHIDDLCDGIL